METDGQSTAQRLDHLIRLQEEELQLIKQGQEIQKQHLELARTQYEKAQRLQERAEQLQDKSAAILNTGRRAMSVILPVVVVLILYVSWLLFG